MAYKVYCHTFPDGKKYIGMTRQDLKRRWRDGKGYEGQPVYDAILKFGWLNVRHEILFDNLTEEEAEIKEIELIEALETCDPDHGYNIEQGGNHSRIAESTKRKLSKKRKVYYQTHDHPLLGRHHSKETREKLSKAHKGKKLSDDVKEKLSKRFSGANNPMYGVKMTKEHKEKLQKACVEATSKKCICIETGIIYSSMAEASRQTGISKRTIGYVCQKHPKYKKAGGFHWSYVEEER